MPTHQGGIYLKEIQKTVHIPKTAGSDDYFLTLLFKMGYDTLEESHVGSVNNVDPYLQNITNLDFPIKSLINSILMKHISSPTKQIYINYFS
jgi:hypothetical protein